MCVVNYKSKHKNIFAIISCVRLEGVAVDIRPCYPLAGEDCSGAESF